MRTSPGWRSDTTPSAWSREAGRCIAEREPNSLPHLRILPVSRLSAPTGSKRMGMAPEGCPLIVDIAHVRCGGRLIASIELRGSACALRVRDRTHHEVRSSRKLAASPIRQEIPVTGSATESGHRPAALWAHERCDRSFGGLRSRACRAARRSRAAHGNFAFLHSSARPSRSHWRADLVGNYSQTPRTRQ